MVANSFASGSVSSGQSRRFSDISSIQSFSSFSSDSSSAQPLSRQFPARYSGGRELSLARVQDNFEENSQIIGDKIFLCLFDKSLDHEKKAEDIKVINFLIAKCGFDVELQGRLLKNVSSKLHSDFKEISLREIFAEDLDGNQKPVSQQQYDDFFAQILLGEKIKSALENLNKKDVAKEQKSSNKIGQDALISLLNLNSAVKNLSNDFGKIKIIDDSPKSAKSQSILMEVMIEENQELLSKLRNFYTKTKAQMVSSQIAVEKSANSNFSIKYSDVAFSTNILASLNFGQYKDEIDELLGGVNRQRSLLEPYHKNQEWALMQHKLSSHSFSDFTSSCRSLKKTHSHDDKIDYTRSISSLSLSKLPFPLKTQLSEQQKINQRALRYLDLGIENLVNLKKNLDFACEQKSSHGLKSVITPAERDLVNDINIERSRLFLDSRSFQQRSERDCASFSRPSNSEDSFANDMSKLPAPVSKRPSTDPRLDLSLLSNNCAPSNSPRSPILIGLESLSLGRF